MGLSRFEDIDLERHTVKKAPKGKLLVLPTMHYVTTKRMADSMRGSRNAIKQLGNATLWGVFASHERAADYIEKRGLRMVAAIVEA